MVSNASVANEAIFTSRKRSLGQGNIFTSVCQEFCSQGDACSQGGCLLPGGVWAGGVPGPGGCPVETPPPDGYCCGRYASYWNALLWICQFGSVVSCFHLVLTTTFKRVGANWESVLDIQKFIPFSSYTRRPFGRRPAAYFPSNPRGACMVRSKSTSMHVSGGGGFLRDWPMTLW